MKRIAFVCCLLFICFTPKTFAQAWLKNLPDKPKEELTFFDYQNAFYSFWEPYHVVNGYYMENGVEVKADGWKQFKRWEHSMKSVVNSVTGVFPDKTALQVVNEFHQNDPPVKSLSAASWTCLGTSSSSGGYKGIGRVNCIAFNPNNNTEIWAGSAGGGLWHSLNNGSTWTPLTDQIAILSISDVLIPSDYATSNTIYIATGDKDQGWNSGSAGVLKSTDGGITWNTTGLTYSPSSNVTVNKLLINPANNQEILAATSYGVYKTTNGGATWNQLLTSTEFVDLEYKPGNFNTLYGSTRTGSIYLSTNSGSTWTQVYTNGSAGRIELGVSPNQPTWVYAVAAKNSSPYQPLEAILKSTNSGSSFSVIFSGSSQNLLGYNGTGNDIKGQSDYDLTIAVSPSNANTVIIGGINTWRSSNGGTSWSIISYWSTNNTTSAQVVHADKHCHVFRSNGDLFEGNDGGIYMSTNNGTNWSDKTNGMVISQLYRLGVSKTDPDEVMTGLQDNGSKLYNGGIWSDVTGGDGMECIISHSNINTQYSTYVEGELYRTTNHWGSYSTITPSSAGTGAWVTPYIMDRNNSQILYGGFSNVWKSTNGGTSWSQISNINSSYKLESLAQAPSNSQVLYVADAYYMWKTTNGGSSWTSINLPNINGNITYITVKNDDPNVVWFTVGGYNTNNVYQSVNGGSTWADITAGLPNIPVHTIIQDVQSTTEVQLFIGTEAGIYSKSGTNTWIPYNTNLPNVRVCELEIYYAPNPADSRLRAATYGRGLWETPIFVSNSAVAGVVSANTIICSGQTASLNVSGSNGTIQWQQSTDNVNWTNVVGGIGQNTATYTTASLTQTLYFRVEVTFNSISVYSNSVSVTIGASLNLPLSEGFEGIFAPTGWTINNANADTYTWESVNAGSSSVKSARVQNYNISQIGNIDELILPKYSFAGITTPVMTFDLSYARYSSSYIDSLIVLISVDCGTTWQRVYQKGNTTLATAPDYSAGMFVPSSSTQWRMETIDLSPYAGAQNVIIKFRNRSGYGQPIYIDNINIQNQATVLASVIISSNDVDNSICAGTSVTFTATPTNGGSSPSYQWKVDGMNAGTNSPTFVTTSLANGQVVSCEMISNLPGVGTTPVTSNTIATTVTNSVTPFVSISASATTICSGTSVSFTAVPTNGGTTPNYQWKVNGINVGTNSPTFTSATLNNNDAVTCVMTSNAPCASPLTCTSNTVSITINTSLTPSVAISASATTICNGTSVSFTAVPTNGGTTPNYQWKVNGINVGTNSPNFTTTTLNNNDAITCVMTSNSTCASPLTGTSNTVSMTVNTSLTPSVAISASATTICNGTSVSFTAVPTNGGTTPNYQWKVNGINVGTNSPTFTSATLNNNDAVTCVMTSNAPCAGPLTGTSNTVSMTVNTSLTPTLTIVPSSTSICSGTTVVFTPSYTNGGFTPAFVWYLNGDVTGSGSTFSSSTLTSLDVVNCLMTSSESCVTTATVESNNVNIFVSTPVTPTVAVSLSGGSNPSCEGELVLFSANPTNGGSSPSYQWKINGINTGTNSPVFSSTNFNDNDVLTCTMTSSMQCASPSIVSSSSITLQINTVPATPTIMVNGNILTSSSLTNNQWYYNGSIISGAVDPSYIMTQNGNYTVIVTENGCSSESSVTYVMNTVGINEQSTNYSLTLSPNPSIGLLHLQFESMESYTAKIVFRNLVGQIIYEDNLNEFDGKVDKIYNFTNLATGEYILSIEQGTHSIHKKFIIQ